LGDNKLSKADWGPGAALLALVMAASLFVEAAPAPGGAVAAVFPPWWSQTRVVTAATAAGRIVAGGGAPFVIALKSNQPGLAARARAHGAWLVFRHDLNGLCVTLGDHQS
jgi:hypothetical protein